MSETDQNVGDDTGDKVGTSTQDETVPMSAYKTQQRKNADKDRIIQEQANRLQALEGDPSVEAQLQSEKKARFEAERALAKERVKTSAPELADIIDEFDITDTALVERLRAKVSQPAASNSSGLRNNPARPVATEDDTSLDILKKGTLFS